MRSFPRYFCIRICVREDLRVFRSSVIIIDIVQLDITITTQKISNSISRYRMSQCLPCQLFTRKLNSVEAGGWVIPTLPGAVVPSQLFHDSSLSLHTVVLGVPQMYYNVSRCTFHISCLFPVAYSMFEIMF